MEKDRIKMAMLKQEQTFRQQVHELHRVYRVQKHLMMQMQATEMTNYGNTTTETQTKPAAKVSCQQWCGSSGEDTLAEDFNLELTLATGAGKRRQEKPSNSDSEATISSSTSAESESGQIFVPKSNVTTVRFQNESNRHDDQVMLSHWRYQCLSLKMA